MGKDNGWKAPHQFNIIQPYLKNVSEFNPSVHGDIKKFFKKQLDGAMNSRAEFEKIPFWVENNEDYIKKQESIICAWLFKCIIHSSDFAPDTDQVNDLMNFLAQVGNENDWDQEFLRTNIIKAIIATNSMELSVDIPILPRVLSNEDYN